VKSHVPVLLSTSSVFPEPTAAAFELAAALGYDGLEVMVWTDAVSQDAGALRGLSEHYGLPILSVHAPCLLVTQRVWSPLPFERLRRSAALAAELGAPVVVVHPPFAWQREYARDFAAGLQRLRETYPGVRFAVENMYPVRVGRRQIVPYAPGWDPTAAGFESYTLDLSHCAAARGDAMDMADRMGGGLAHVHLGDGTGEGRDEHLVPGRGTQPCGALLASLAGRGFTGSVAVEVSTRKAASRGEREEDLAEALTFARGHLSSTVDA
jgi:sugar phosphate isomerase/epimerase